MKSYPQHTNRQTLKRERRNPVKEQSLRVSRFRVSGCLCVCVSVCPDARSKISKLKVDQFSSTREVFCAWPDEKRTPGTIKRACEFCFFSFSICQKKFIRKQTVSTQARSSRARKQDANRIRFVAFVLFRLGWVVWEKLSAEK